VKLPKLKREHTKLAVVALLASVLTAAPIAVIANAQNTQEPNPILEMINGEEPVVEEQPPAEEPEETPPPVQETPPPVEEPEPPVEENETPVEEPEPTAVDILAAIAIAKTAHDEVAGEEAAVIMAQVKLKKLDEEKVYKVVFDDGWRIYVRASDGEIVLMKDHDNRKHGCGNRGRGAVANWRNHFKKKWGYQPSRNHYQSPGQDDQSDDDNQPEQEEPTGTEETAEQEG